MSDFSTDNMVVRATERYAYGWVDKRVLDGPASSREPPWMTVNLRMMATTIFPFEAQMRGWSPESYKGGNAVCDCSMNCGPKLELVTPATIKRDAPDRREAREKKAAAIFNEGLWP